MVALARATPGRRRIATRRCMRGLEAIHLQSLRAHGVTLSDARIRELLALDLELNAQGIAIWLDRDRTMNDVRFDFTGSVAVVTGAANGIGAACARLFAASGARGRALGRRRSRGAGARARARRRRRAGARGGAATSRAAATSPPRSPRRWPPSAASTS